MELKKVIVAALTAAGPLGCGSSSTDGCDGGRISVEVDELVINAEAADCEAACEAQALDSRTSGTVPTRSWHALDKP